MFMRVYKSIPTNIKPSAGAAKLHYLEAFDNDFALLLRERKSSSLPVMFTDALELESNMMACGKIKPRVDVDKRKGREEIMPSTSSASSSNDIKFEMMLKKMEKLMDRLNMDTSTVNREYNEPHIRNPNFRRPIPPDPLPQNRQRDMRNPRNQEYQQIRPPFPKNCVSNDDGAESIEDRIHHFGDLDSEIYLAKEGHSMFAQEDDNKYFEEELD